MAVGLQGSGEVTISMDDAAAAPQVVTGFVMTLGKAAIKVETQSSDAFGDLWDEFAPTGRRGCPPIAISGLFNTTATTGPHVVFKPADADALPNAATRTLVIVFGDSKTFTVETRISDYSVEAKNGKLSEYSCTLTPTGAAVWS